MEKYDALDGVADRVIGNPLAVDFVPARDLPRDPEGKNGFHRCGDRGIHPDLPGPPHR